MFLFQHSEVQMTNRESARRKKARSLLLRHGYAVGGHVKQAIAEAVHAHEKHDHKGKKLTKLVLRQGLRSGGAAEEAKPTRRADKPRRGPADRATSSFARGGRAKKAGTKIIIVNGHPQPMPVPRPVPVPVGAAPAAPPLAAARPPLPGPMPAPMPGAAPLPGTAPIGMARPPMAKRGGRMGSGPHMTAGSKTALGRLQKMRAYGRPPTRRPAQRAE